MLGLGLIQKAGQRILGGLNALIKTLTRRATYSENTADSNSVVEAIDTAGILDNATILLTPTAYSDARVHSVKTYTGNELVTNGDFSDGRNDWTNNASATLSTENDKLKVSISGAGSGYGQQNITGLTIGATYKISAEGEIGTSTRLALYTPNAGFNNLYADGAISTFFTATSTTENLRLYVYDDGAYGFWDNVSVIDVSSDFDFDRASSATRINSSGLVQDMQSITDPELVLNGDFEELGNEKITNGTFDTDSDWNKAPSGVTIIGGSANFNSASDTYVYQDILTATKTYKIIFSGTINTGSFYIGENGVATNIYTAGTYTNEVAYFTVSSSARFIIRKTGVGTLDASIDNVSVQQVNVDSEGNDIWDIYETGSSTVTFTDVASINIDGSNSNAGLYQENVFEDEKTYKIVLTMKATAAFDAEILETQGAALETTIGDVNLTTSYQDFIFYFTATGTNDLFIHRKYGQTDGQNQQILISNVSVKDITFSTDVDLARINYDSNGENGHILLEPTSTNLFTYSEDFSDRSWSENLGTVTLTSEVAPDGTTNSVFNYVGNNSNLFTQTQASGVEYTISFFVKSNNQGKDNFQLRLGSSSMKSEVFTATSEWVRYSYTNTPTSSIFSITSEGANGVDILIWGAQLEALPYATSYIPTLTGSTVTRAAETLTGSGNSTLINSTEGVLYAEIAAFSNDDSYRYMGLTDGTDNNRVIILYYSNNNRIRVLLSSSGTKYLDEYYTVSSLVDFHKIALKWKVNDFALWVDGVERVTDTSGSAPIGLNTLAFDQAGVSNFYGKCKALAVFDRALIGDELRDLTTQ